MERSFCVNLFPKSRLEWYFYKVSTLIGFHRPILSSVVPTVKSRGCK
jgi:hypothetical protein